MSNLNKPDFDTRPVGAVRPEHHLHDSSEPLPGAAGAQPTSDYNSDNFAGEYASQTRRGSQTQDRLAEYGSGMPETTTIGQDKPAQVGFDNRKAYDTAARDASATGI
jgi:hypothetical protein